MKILTLEIYFWDNDTMHNETYTLNAFNHFQLIREFLRITANISTEYISGTPAAATKKAQKELWNNSKYQIQKINLKFPNTIIGSVDYVTD